MVIVVTLICVVVVVIVMEVILGMVVEVMVLIVMKCDGDRGGGYGGIILTPTSLMPFISTPATPRL